jgi:hypothetical protein
MVLKLIIEMIADKPLIFEPVRRYKPWGISIEDAKEVFPWLNIGDGDNRLGELFLISTQRSKVGKGREAVVATPIVNYGPIGSSGIIQNFGESYLGGAHVKKPRVEGVLDLDTFVGAPESWYVWKVKGDVDLVHGFKEGVTRTSLEEKIANGFFVRRDDESESVFFDRLKHDCLEITAAREGAVYVNDPGKVHTVVAKEKNSYAIILEVRGGYDAPTLTAKFLCVGNGGMSLQVHPSKEQVQSVISKDPGSDLARLFMNDPSLRLCDILHTKRDMHSTVFAEYVDFDARGGEIMLDPRRDDRGIVTSLFDSEVGKGYMYDINPNRQMNWNGVQDVYTHVIVLEGNVFVEYGNGMVQSTLAQSFSIPANSGPIRFTSGNDGCKIVFFRENE